MPEIYMVVHRLWYFYQQWYVKRPLVVTQMTLENYSVWNLREFCYCGKLSTTWVSLT